MLYDLSALHSGVEDVINIDTTISFDKEQLKDTGIIKLDGVQVLGTITKNSTSQDEIKIEVKGEMLLEDSISLEEVNYPFSFEFDKILEENDKKDENTLDITDILWENIILEIPLKFTKVEDLSEYHGDGWKLVNEDDLKKENNPFSDLLKEFGEE